LNPNLVRRIHPRNAKRWVLVRVVQRALYGARSRGFLLSSLLQTSFSTSALDERKLASCQGEENGQQGV
jgi:hypothetical protein